MLVIRLQRVGKKKQASFRVVLQEKSWKPQGKIKELLGFYDPHSKDKKFQAERVQYWIGQGAQPTPTVHNIFVDAGIIEGPKKKAWKPKPKSAEVPSENEGTKPEVSSDSERQEDPKAKAPGEDKGQEESAEAPADSKKDRDKEESEKPEPEEKSEPKKPAEPKEKPEESPEEKAESEKKPEKN